MPTRWNYWPITAAVLASALLVAAPASASLVGDSVNLKFFFPDDLTIVFDETKVVDTSGTPEFDVGGIFFDVDAFSITITFGVSGPVTIPGPLAAGALFDLDFLPPGSVIGLDFVTNIPGFGTDRLGFISDAVSVDLAGLEVGPDSFAVIALLTDHVRVPAPATLMLAGLGLAVLAGAARIRRRTR